MEGGNGAIRFVNFRLRKSPLNSHPMPVCVLLTNG